jgi:UPF0755 protein
VKTFLVLLTTLVISGLLLFGSLAAHIYFATPGRDREAKEVRVDQGDTLSTVARNLREQRIIVNDRLFLLWARLTKAEKKIHWGLYRFDSSLPASEVLDRLVTGRGILLGVTIPEGLTVKQIAELLAQKQLVDKDKFLTETENPQLLAALDLQDKPLEGYLFPSTYYFAPGTPERSIVAMMTEQFRKVSRPLFEQVDDSINMTPHEILTLASIIERETGVEAERPLVSAVFHNRLRLGMPLQSDPTVIYGIPDFNGNLTRKDLQESTPYNTYRIPALPPGPICNPGLASIKAALHPAHDASLYFVSKNDGTHQFSENLQTHEQAVKIFQPVRPPAVRLPVKVQPRLR